MSRKNLAALLFAVVAATPLAATTPSHLAPQWQTTPTMWESGTYTYDGAGNIIAIGADQYRYDGASRLVNATANTPSHANAQTFQYDDYGNLLRVDTQVTPTAGAPVNTAMVMPVLSGKNQLLENPSASDCPPGVICVAGKYDAAGNQTLSNGYISYEWDALGNLVKLTSGLGRVERYIYDASNERIMTMMATGSVERREYTLRNDDAKVLRELVDTVTSGTHQWSWTKDYVYRSGSLLAAISPETTGEAIQHFHLDHLGTPRVTTDARGYRLSLHTYLPYGVEATGSETDGERLKFTGHERDFGGGPGEDLDYMHARYYAPNAGRFLSVDPVLGDPSEPQSWNRYAYARNSPLLFTDPTGTFVDLSRLTPAERQKLIDGLNDFTGNTYDIDPNTNHLVLVSVGSDSSATATAFVNGLIGSQSVAYDVVAGKETVYNPTLNRIEINFQAFDGANYNGLDPRTFNLGYSAIHEWKHQTTGLKDTPDGQPTTKMPPDTSWTGPIVDAVNVMRRERGLPTRAAYHTEDVQPAGFKGFFGIGQKRSSLNFFDPKSGRTIKVIRNVP